MIQVQNFTKRYGDRDVVKNLSFTAKDGVITGFIGHNGAGKSTTIKAITGVIRPTAGKIAIVLGLIMFVLFFVSVVAFPLMTSPGFTNAVLIASIVLSLVVLAAAFAVDLAVMKKAAGNFERLEACVRCAVRKC